MENEILKTIKTYNEVADEYSRINVSLDPIQNLVDLFVDNINGNIILDAGCGHGRDAEYLSKLGFGVVGIDLSYKLLDIARKKAQKASFYLMDMRKLGFHNNSFDAIWACASFLHIPKKEAKQTLKEFHRVLKNTGMIFISVKRGNGERYVKSQKYKEKERFYAFYSMNKLINLLKSTGLEPIEELIEKSNGRDTTWINIFAKAKKE